MERGDTSYLVVRFFWVEFLVLNDGLILQWIPRLLL